MSHEKIRAQIILLSPVIQELKEISCINEKISRLNKFADTNEKINFSLFQHLFSLCMHVKAEFVVKAILTIEQGSIVFNILHLEENRLQQRFQDLIEHLIEIEDFYQQIGGIIGYHVHFLNLILDQNDPLPPSHVKYFPPKGWSIQKETKETCHFIQEGIHQLKQIALFLPIGGAGDRLNLIDEMNHTPLPAAILPFLGRTLLEGLIRDLQAYEYLFYKLFQERIHIPIALMTSQEKDNHRYIYDIIASHQWFGRPADSFHFFMQPLVPVITEEGNWSLKESLVLTLKPGGHGVMWKLAKDKGVFNKLASQGYHQAFIRQINNPIANTDHAILALIGMGSAQNKSFGFLSCERILSSAEGANVLIEEKTSEGYSYCISNVEYTDFNRKTIGEIPLYEGSAYSKYPSNTNILYVNISAVEKALELCSIPGALINMKTFVPFIDSCGVKTEIKGGRLECTMQNIADYIQDQKSDQIDSLQNLDALQTFIVFSDRIKTISTTKKSFKINESVLDTPEQAYYDLQHNNRELFEKRCDFSIPTLLSFEMYLQKGPTSLILFHPCLGPLYSIIAQKIRKGCFAKNAELQLEIVEIDIENLDLEGSLIIECVDPLGIMSCSNPLNYNPSGNCTLKNVTIRNKGIDRQLTKNYWKNQLIRHEKVHILLHEGAEFHAENLNLTDSHIFEIPAYHRLKLIGDVYSDEIKSEITPIDQPTWHWKYEFDEEKIIHLTRIEN